MIKWLRGLTHLREDVEHLTTRVRTLERIIKSVTEIDVDLAGHVKGRNTIIMIGRYRDRDLIQVFDVSGYDFKSILHILRDLRRQGQLNVIDMPYGMDATVLKEIDF